MDERGPLYQAILEEPDDDAPRLVYADWLEENGEEADRDQAAFILRSNRTDAPGGGRRPAGGTSR